MFLFLALLSVPPQECNFPEGRGFSELVHSRFSNLCPVAIDRMEAQSCGFPPSPVTRWVPWALAVSGQCSVSSWELGHPAEDLLLEEAPGALVGIHPSQGTVELGLWTRPHGVHQLLIPSVPPFSYM